MPSIVTWRVRASNANEIYGTASIGASDAVGGRVIDGRCLVSVVAGEGPCGDCMLRGSSSCAGRH